MDNEITPHVKTTYGLYRLFVPTDVPPNALFQLEISIADKDIRIRDFVAFLSTIDRIYGRYYVRGYRSYAKTRDEQLGISSIQTGTINFVLSELISNIRQIEPLILIYIFVKYGPGILESISASYKNIEEGRLAKAQRIRIYRELKKDEILRSLNNREIKKIGRYLYTLIIKDRRLFEKSMVFIITKVKKVSTRTKINKDGNE